MVALVLLAAIGAAPAAGLPDVEYDPPIDAPIVDPFRPPPGPYAAGNRGIEYAIRSGAPVRAAADGTVTFAGLVAGARHVTVQHADGIRTTYSYLASIAVRPGQRLRRGEVVGTTATRLHVGARRGATYVDPAKLWEDGRIVLVPLDGGEGHGDDGQVAPPGPPSAPGAWPPPGADSTLDALDARVAALPW